ncbi:hypothetical protein FBU59_005271 [Linderina macrospora]|uniref:Uncharacterized protein n=1 Tax=Linderina macrospora TaxID=4868 RepID=A0ACC1J388_9FUNG|nr:hypothetical protein FBU59_005271 [Linderina macrospora]
MNVISFILLFIGICAAADLSIGQLAGMYAMVQRLAQYKTFDGHEQDIYAKLAVFLGDFETANALYVHPQTANYRNALYKLMDSVVMVKAQSRDNYIASLNADYLANRIRMSYIASLTNAVFS